METEPMEVTAIEEIDLPPTEQSEENNLPESDVTNDKQKALEDSLRMQIKNLPKFMKFQQLKKLLQKHLPSIEFRKVKISEDNAYVSFLNVEGLNKGLKVFDGFEIKGKKLFTKHVPEESTVERKPSSPKPLKSAKELTTPLAHLSYEEQLEEKQRVSIKVALNLKKQCVSSGIHSARHWIIEHLVKKILPSPVRDHYRNKSEHTVGYDEQGEICVGFVATRLQDKQLTTVPVYDCLHLRKNTLNVNRAFEEYVKQSGLPPFHEFERKGFWRQILIRDFLADCMVVINVFPFEDEELFEKIKKELINVFMPSEPMPTKDFRVTSLYIAVQRNASDEPKIEKLAGTPYVYERLFNIKFRISPNTFFQTNTIATEVLYIAVGDALGLPKAEPLIRLPAIIGDGQEGEGKGFILSAIEKEKPATTDDGPAAKKPKIEAKNENDEGQNGNTEDMNEVPEVKEEKSAEVETPSKKRILLLDICCGAGTIGLSLAKRVEKATAQGKFEGIFGLVGVELVQEAVTDAELNAKDNHLKPNTYRYIPGKAEAIFSSLNYFVPNCFKTVNASNPELKDGEIIGVIDPPRAGMNDRVIIGCRKLEQMKRLVYVSCDPSAALKNVIDLCRPMSRKYEGTPFTVTSIQPVDMFPLTTHFEWVIQLDR